MRPAILSRSAIVACAAVLCSTVCTAASKVDPVADGLIWLWQGVNTVDADSYVTIDQDRRGVIKFSLPALSGSITSAVLSVNPYGLPISSVPIQVYAFRDIRESIHPTDYYDGTFLGNWTLPTDLNFGQDAFFDVTSFVAETNTSIMTFVLRSTGLYALSSLEFNYGHPSQLTISSVPEPPAAVYLIIALPLLFALRGRARHPRTKTMDLHRETDVSEFQCPRAEA